MLQLQQKLVIANIVSKIVNVRVQVNNGLSKIHVSVTEDTIFQLKSENFKRPVKVTA